MYKHTHTQTSQRHSVELLDDPNSDNVNTLATLLGLKKVSCLSCDCCAILY